MYIYLVVFATLLLFSLFEVISNGYKRRTVLYILSGVLLFLCTFRYGQGTDYFGYEKIYESFSGDNIFVNILMYRDLFFSALFYYANIYSVPFETIVSILAVSSLLMFFCFNIRFNRYPVLGLLVFYSLFHLTYNYSAIREGFAISFFLAFMLPLLLKEKVPIGYYLLGVFVVTMHGSAIITLLFPLLKKFNNRKHIIVFALFAVVLSSIVWVLPFGALLENRMESYVESSSGVNIFAIITRLIALVPIAYINKTEKLYKDISNIYICFIFIYLVFISVPTLAARESIYLQVLSVVMLTTPLTIMKSKRRVGYFFILALFCGVMYFKCIDSYIQNGHYRSNITVLNYPYVSVFNKDLIFQYRDTE